MDGEAVTELAIRLGINRSVADEIRSNQQHNARVQRYTLLEYWWQKSSNKTLVHLLHLMCSRNEDHDGPTLFKEITKDIEMLHDLDLGKEMSKFAKNNIKALVKAFNNHSMNISIA